jgi:hypothetical protein
MTHDFNEFAAYIVHLRAEHRRLHECLRRIQRDWAARQSALGIGVVLEDMKALRAELAHHFAEEESGGCLEEAIARQPRLAPEADRLERQHVELLGHLDRLVEQMNAAAQTGRRADDAKSAFGHFAHELRRHEHAENRLLKQGFGVEPDEAEASEAEDFTVG